MKQQPRHWEPLVESLKKDFKPPAPELIAEFMKVYKCDQTDALKRIEYEDRNSTYWVNSLYQVRRTDIDGGWVHLNIRRRDGAAIIRDWRHFQEIKNQLVGPECEGLEIYPAESRKVDTSNKYHLYVCTDPSFQFPFGWRDRDVAYDDVPSVPGMRQRPL